MLLDREKIDEAARHIRSGKLVAFPTETVYGLGANALDANAVARIFEMKERPSMDPLIVHIADDTDLNRLTKSDDPRVLTLSEKFWPGPLTIVLPKSELVPDIVTSGLPTVGIRMPDNIWALELIHASGCPIAAPSANKFGRVSPTKAEHVRKALPELDYILDGGQTNIGIESTIISLDDQGFIILRPGFITELDLLSVLPKSDNVTLASNPLAPGMLKSHYSPVKPLFLIEEDKSTDINKFNSALISYGSYKDEAYKRQINLAKDGNLINFAINMFDAIHQLEDDPDVEQIHVLKVPENGIGIAIMDRLRKAAYAHQNKA
jgi:L-threonylcarbamoyladenylate synthase